MPLVIAALLFFFPLAFSEAQRPLPELRVELYGVSEEQMPETVLLGIILNEEQPYIEYRKDLKSVDPNEANYIEEYSVGGMKITKKDDNYEYFYDGSFLFNGYYYLVYPTSFKKTLPPRAHATQYMLGVDQYTVTRQSLYSISGNSYGADVIRSDNHQALTVELFVHIDYSIYVKWLEFTNGKADKAISDLKSFYSRVLHGVNVNYERIKRADFSISIHVKTFYVETAKSIYVGDNYNVTSKKITKYPLVALNTAIDWWSPGANRKDYDAGIFFGNLNLYDHTGITYMKSICSETAVAVISHSSPLELVSIVTHEIAHILGSSHDGRPDNHCDYGYQYLMAPSLENFNKNTISNIFKFSPCSISYIKLLIQRINSLNQNCMLNAPSGEQDLQKNDQLLGERYTPAQQCKLLYGPGSYLCNKIPVKDDICQHISCFQPLKRYCEADDRQTAADGTQCGNKMWCIDGVCVQNERESASDKEVVNTEMQ